MLIIIKLGCRLLAFFLFALPSVTFAQVAVSGAEWTGVSNFKYCEAGNCKIYRRVELTMSSIDVGQDISVVNLDTGTEIAKFQVKSIKYGRQVQMCWIGDREGRSETYISVSGCKR